MPKLKVTKEDLVCRNEKLLLALGRSIDEIFHLQDKITLMEKIPRLEQGMLQTLCFKSFYLIREDN